MKKRNLLHCILYLLLLTAAVIWNSFYGGVFPYVVLYSIVFLPFAAGLYIFYVQQSLHFYQELSSHKVIKGDMVSYRLILENTGILPIVSVKLIMEKERSIFRKFDDEKIFSLMPGERIEFDSEIVCRYSGAYNIGVLAFLVEDCFHFFSWRYKAPSDFRAIVKPRLTEDAADQIDFDDLRSQMEMKIPYFFENILSNDLREYHYGDSLKQIHWKNTARTNEVLVRKPEPRQIQGFHIVMIQTEVSEELDAVIRRDRFLESAVSVAHYFFMQNKPVTFHYYENGMNSCLVDSYLNFNEFYEEIPDKMRSGEPDREKLLMWVNENCLGDSSIVLFLYEDYGDKNPLQRYRIDD